MKRTILLLLALLCACAVAAAEPASVVTTGAGVSVVPASDWAETYPDVYASYLKNQENSAVIDHVEEYPMIATVYEGMAFNAYYNSARGHYYTVEDVTSTGRPHKLANCFTCKTPDFTAAVNNEGVSAYTMPFEDMLAKVNESISCYNCHANEAGSVVVTHTYLAEAMGADFDKVDKGTAACAQCHVEYYFDPETKATTLPYGSLSAMSPDSIYAYYEEMDFRTTPTRAPACARSRCSIRSLRRSWARAACTRASSPARTATWARRPMRPARRTSVTSG